MTIEQVKYNPDVEDIYFKEQEQKLIQKIREKAAEEADRKYREDHCDHCFRCGTKSLVEVERGNVKIDVCVNEDCGAIHLDPGELDEIAKDQGVIKSVRSAIFSVFK